jgi:hypothetical protein
LNDLFPKTLSNWVRFSEYEYRKLGDSLYILPTESSKITLYNPLELADSLVADAANLGLLCMSKKPDIQGIKPRLLDFVTKYGLLGIMTALPTTPDFLDYDTVYLPKNPLIKSEAMTAADYVNVFFPFEEAEAKRTFGLSLLDLLLEHENKTQKMLAENFLLLPGATSMCLRRGYGERFDWLCKQFGDWAYLLYSSALFYDEKEETVKELHRRAMAAFGGVAPHYRIVLDDDKPRMVWDFHSLLQTVQIVLSFAIVDEQRPLRICKNCSAAFVAQDPRARFCSHDCKNQFGVRHKRSQNR